MKDERKTGWVVVDYTPTVDLAGCTTTEAMQLGNGCLVKTTTTYGGYRTVNVLYVPEAKVLERTIEPGGMLKHMLQ